MAAQHTSSHHATTSDADREELVRRAAFAVGAVFVLVGVLGITSPYADLSCAGHHSMAKLLGVFQVSVLHNVVHLLFGVAGLLLARNGRTAVSHLIGKA